MPWIRFTDKFGREWEFNDYALYALVRQHIHNNLYNKNLKFEQKEGPGLVFSKPKYEKVVVDWNFINKQKEIDTAKMLASLNRTIRENPEATFEQLSFIRASAIRNSDKIKEKMQNSSKRTMRSIEASVNKQEKNINDIKFLNDMMLVGASFLTGGAAATVIATGSIVKGVAKYSEQGNLGAALIEAKITLIAGIIPLGFGAQGARKAINLANVSTKAALKKEVAEKGAILVVGAGIDSSFELAKGLVEGKTLKEAGIAAGFKALSHLAIGGYVNKILNNALVPIAVRITKNSGVQDVVENTVSYVTGQVSDELNNIATKKVVSLINDNNQQIKETKNEDLFDIKKLEKRYSELSPSMMCIGDVPPTHEIKVEKYVRDYVLRTR